MTAVLRDQLIRLAYENPDMREHVLPLVKEAARGASGTVKFFYQTRKPSQWTVEVTALIPIIGSDKSRFLLKDLGKWHKETYGVVKAAYESVNAVAKRVISRGEAAYGVKVSGGKVEEEYIASLGDKLMFRFVVSLNSHGEIDPGMAEMVAATLSNDVKPGFDYQYQNIN